MKFIANNILFISIYASNVFLASGETCLESWAVELSGFSYDALIAAVNQKLGETSCNHNAEIELQLALGVDTFSEAKAKVLQEYKESYFKWEGISKKGLIFDKEVFDGGTYYNEERESLDEYGVYRHRLSVDPGQRIRFIHDEIASENGIEFPAYLTNFENCELRAAMCCFVQDRQANDKNGNCKEPYEEKCVDADPADNTDICYHDMENSPTSSRTEKGFNIFQENDDGDSHCHGLAWATDEFDSSNLYKGNNLFYITLYDHLVTRGYVGNVPGAPKCACIEQMPVVTRADCTEIETENEEIEISYSMGGDFEMSIVNLDIKFNACQGANDNNNDLEAYYEQLTNDGKATEVELAKLRHHLVGETYCPEAIDSLLNDKGIEKIPECDEGDPENCGCDEVKQADYRGTISVTKSGKECQRWDTQEPHKHNRKRNRFPNSNLVENYCRNPDGEDGAWCYTTDPNKKFELCDVPVCGIEPPTMAPTSTCAPLAGETCGCADDGQAGYRGTINVTEAGFPCQRWDTKAKIIRRNPNSGLVENYCRNPDGESRAWCYSSNPKKRFEFCDVPYCQTNDDYSMSFNY
jgi:hypothetical protein